jgi:hypothetical protein
MVGIVGKAVVVIDQQEPEANPANGGSQQQIHASANEAPPKSSRGTPLKGVHRRAGKANFQVVRGEFR